ncbi:LOW QUALITY PROTEIN: vomeronasal type-1 receptor 48-like [Psammomys obesus]|uniref:LOW QUALITY PROTEIN: vomeronasal type-1 receptor 48-like n=1 Tax=Psammomys obesus TaxID=48139 RepID=UPI0024535CAD|nr:LOW QUALITY PROTEIN: vomeronasal type-1 receptor 48-like [Psammomys obesus]
MYKVLSFFPPPLFAPTQMNKNSRLHTNSNIRNTVFSEIGIGISANSFLLLFYILKFIRGHRPRPTDVLIVLLALMHLLMLIFTAFIVMDIFISLRGWDDTICKLIVYLYRIFRGISLCTTCLLSVLQAITLSPRQSYLAKFKHKFLHYNLYVLLFLSVFYISISSHLSITIVATPNLTSDNFMYVTNSCSLLPMSYLMRHIFSALLTLREVFLISLMVLSSGYMVILLYRHKKQARHLHSTSLSPKASPEQRATRTILLLMSFFVVMSILDSIISYSRTMLNDHPIFYCIQILVAHSYAALSPLVFISIEVHTISFSESMCGRTAKISNSVNISPFKMNPYTDTLLVMK